MNKTNDEVDTLVLSRTWTLSSTMLRSPLSTLSLSLSLSLHFLALALGACNPAAQCIVILWRCPSLHSALSALYVFQVEVVAIVAPPAVVFVIVIAAMVKHDANYMILN